MTTQTLILISYLAIISVLSHLMRKWSIGILLILPVPFIVQLTANVGCLWILTVITLTILDIRRKREKSVFIKYNPIAAATKSVAADRGEKLQHLSDECIKESSNVVRRINATGIGEINASKMASDFSAYYIQLHQKCCKAVERIE